MEVIDKYIKLWNEVTSTKSDPRTSRWFMMDSPLPSLIICFLYVVFVKIGCSIMKKRKEPFEINNILVIYNFAMVALSGYLFYELLFSGWLLDYSFGCQPVDYSNSPQAIRMASICWLFYMSKFIELLDTVFFILRKKFNQVSFLHVFHHGIMPCTWWFGVRFVPGGFGSFHALINSFIHFVMYAYYGISALGPEYQKYLWYFYEVNFMNKFSKQDFSRWKKYMTKMQMVQFFLVMVHSSQLFFVECDYPILFAYWICSYAIIFMIFFSNFYFHEYISRKKGKKAQ